MDLRLAEKEALLQKFSGRCVRELPTPSCVLNRGKMAVNCKAMLESAQRLNVSFRAHIKTHKTLEGVRLQLGSPGRYGRIIVSTLAELSAILPLVQEGSVTDVLYGVPFALSKIDRLSALADQVPHLRLMVDSETQLDALLAYSRSRKSTKPWSAFIKVDCGYGRAGLPPNSPALKSLVTRVLSPEVAKTIQLYGFYSHAGHSYHDDNLSDATSTLLHEVNAVNGAAKLAQSLTGSDDRSAYVLSVGATPTAHASQEVASDGFGPLEGQLEIHAGCYGICDLQQHATGLIEYDNIAIRVLAEVASHYRERNEMLIDAGVLALSREQGPHPGFGDVEAIENGWIVGRMSQEHGILTRPEKENGGGERGRLIPIGEKILIVPQHACITGACYDFYFVVDDDGLDARVVDVWLRYNHW